MRGALKKLPGIGRVEISAGKREFAVDYDSQKVKPEQFLPVLKEAGQPAKIVQG